MSRIESPLIKKSHWYGTDYIQIQTENELLNQVKMKLHLFRWLNKGDVKKIPKRIILDIVEVLEVLKFSDMKFPYILVFGVNERGRILKTSIYKDPFYHEGLPKGFSGNPRIYPRSLIEFENDIGFLKEKISYLARKQKYSEIAIAGSDDHFLVIGKANPRSLRSNRLVYSLR